MKSSILADLRPTMPLRYGPVSLWPESREWQAAHCSNTVLPRPASWATAACVKAIAPAMAKRWKVDIRMLFIVPHSDQRSRLLEILFADRIRHPERQRSDRPGRIVA